MRWGIFVDTDSLYLGIREKFGQRSRMDYLRLPERLASVCGVDDFQKLVAMVVRYGRGWQFFGESLRRFGYEIIVANRREQQLRIGLEVPKVLFGVDGLVVVTASPNVSALVDHVLFCGKTIRVASFFPTIDFGSEIRDMPGLILMDENWLWTEDFSEKDAGEDRD